MPVPPPLTRRYVVVGVNHGGRRGAGSAVVAVPLWPPPPPPPSVNAKAIETGTELDVDGAATPAAPVMANALPDRVRAPVPAGAGAVGRRTERLPDEDDDEPRRRR